MIMRSSLSLYALFALLTSTLAMTAAGCRLLGFEGSACDPENPATCPEGQVCNQEWVGAGWQGLADLSPP